jgi:hypothetical protein
MIDEVVSSLTNPELEGWRGDSCIKVGASLGSTPHTNVERRHQQSATENIGALGDSCT